MRHALALICGALAFMLACSRVQPGPDMQPSPGTGYVVTTTGAAVGRDNPNATNEPELSLDEAATRLAGQLCAREVLCHDEPAIAGSCVAQYLRRARSELGRWECSPAASRARTKACLASIRNEPCDLDFAKRARLCGANVGCPDPDVRLTPPGAAHGP